jgi:hypothetical protein
MKIQTILLTSALAMLCGVAFYAEDNNSITNRVKNPGTNDWPGFWCLRTNGTWYYYYEDGSAVASNKFWIVGTTSLQHWADSPAGRWQQETRRAASNAPMPWTYPSYPETWPKPTVEWIGKPVMMKKGLYLYTNQLPLTTMQAELGLRSDGVVVWRKAQ